MKEIKKILLVCTGNSCRSIMAEGYLVKRLKELGIKADVMSAGTNAAPGLKPTEEAVQVTKENGIDISEYTSSRLNKVQIDAADIILVMSRHHRDDALNLEPEAKNKIRFLREFSLEKTRRTDTIDDPIGKPVRTYREIFEIIKDSIEGFLKWLKK